MSIEPEFRKKFSALLSSDPEFRTCANVMARAHDMTVTEALDAHTQEFVDLFDSWWDPGIDEAEQFSLDPTKEVDDGAGPVPS